ncbi:NCS2 family permease [Methanococcus maripaludis]|uniref:Xanthine/uracil permease family n=2 Tax=Methanococcus maripaludis TaxID=39152 RepID=Q6LZE0_METMP|nr:NCS2 family permease [Methanococcus maripaludis]MBA2846537.1 AGZA family xanthine/uracil permease-like MFS transporter [Methanococcus maripaludis]MBA2850901.1 AGZA family xanthine/uracil permease-like MFS transporter [Methanococcus maripaludis]MBA2853772.1 AGZA family xanthine/uracil permease-like MFS transporter [Methanococcus maripaludis]MBA2858404.1 AGZA family xanthine/uracil permease-like MFS transporter [Methanococcus maripaludis]MBA2860589.1 AGZA family xanthine/uracil permease-like 
MANFLARYFGFEEHKTNFKVETMAGVTTFMTMAYIIFVNPSILSLAGMDFGAVMVATCISAALGTFIMGVYAKYPFALAPGMGLNAFFTFGVVMGMGLSWQTALGAVFISGILFILLTLTKIRTWIFDAIPDALKYGTAVGIGLFIAFIGLKSAGVIVANEATLVGLGNVLSPATFLALFGLFATAAMMARKVTGAILWGIILTAVIGMGLGVSALPAGLVAMPPSLAPTLMQMDVMGALSFGLINIILAFFFVDLFDTLGTLSALSSQAGYMKDGKLPKAEKALMSDSVATAVGAALGTSTVTSYVESASGIGLGGRTGFVSVVVAALFLLSIFFSPFVAAIPAYATAPALIIVGALMISAIKRIDLDDITESVPAFIALITIPLTYSIATGLQLGFIFYPLIKIIAGRSKEVHPIVYLLAIIFAARFVYIG